MKLHVTQCNGEACLLLHLLSGPKEKSRLCSWGHTHPQIGLQEAIVCHIGTFRRGWNQQPPSSSWLQLLTLTEGSQGYYAIHLKNHRRNLGYPVPGSCALAGFCWVMKNVFCFMVRVATTLQENMGVGADSLQLYPDCSPSSSTVLWAADNSWPDKWH